MVHSFMPMSVESNAVLVVDDDPGIRTALKLVLEYLGFEAILAENGRVGLETLKKQYPVLILLDVMMPEMNGWEFLDIIQADKNLAAIPVVTISAFQFQDTP